MSTFAPNWHRSVPKTALKPTLLGLAVLAVWIGGFGFWAVSVPLDGAVIAQGVFVAFGENKQIQHFEGGIIGKVHVKEGDVVNVGQPLAVLDQTSARAKLRQLLLREYRLLIMQARLDAELAERETFSMPGALRKRWSDPEIIAMYQRQKDEMQSQREKDEAEEEVIQKEVAGLRASIGGYSTQVESIRRRMTLFHDELKDKDKLLALRLARKPEVLALQRTQASLGGELGNNLGKIGDSKQKIARAEQQIEQKRVEGLLEASEELRKTETELDDVHEQLLAAEHVVKRAEIRSPIDGVVVKIHHQTEGAVVAPGAVMMEVVPSDGRLIIEARVAPVEISKVKVGQGALIKLSALNRGQTPMVEASVVYLSADAISELGSQTEGSLRSKSFVVRVALDNADLRSKIETFNPTPGMPVEVYIKTGKRTFFDYIMRPVSDTVGRPLREL